MATENIKTRTRTLTQAIGRNHYRQTINGKKAVAYKTGDAFRTETVNVQIEKGNSSNNVETSAGQTTSANGNKYYTEMQVDSLNIDFNQDVQFSKSFTTDWDLRSDNPTGVTTSPFSGSTYGWDANHGFDLRIQGLINFNAAWRNRHLLDTDTSNDLDNPDILWTRIEGDPIWSDSRSANEKSLNSVHQMIINVHADNTATEIQNNQIVYTYRPFFIFYMGPEVNDKVTQKANADKTFAENTSIRKSQPVILNLYEDWNAILYMPNSPVIINGNGHKLTGFVIAKEYLKLKDDSDYSNYTKATDDYGNEIYIKSKLSDTITEDTLNELIADNEYVVNEDYKGYKTLFEKIEAPRYPIISVSAEDVKTYDSLTDYINATYKDKFKAYSGLTDDKITSVTFPHNKIAEYYAVATEDLSDTEKVGYVKVLVGETEKYIDKAKLPYVKVRRDSIRAYVSVYDLQQERTSKVYGVNTIDDSNALAGEDSSGDLWRPATDTYKSDRFIDKTLWDNKYSKEYIDSKLIAGVNMEGLKYLMLKSEMTDEPRLVDEYHKIIFGTGDTKEIRWISENKKTYYIKILPGGSYKTDTNGNYVESNYIFIDNKGDLQTKTLSGVTRKPMESYEEPDDEEYQKKITNPVTGEKHDYRDMTYEVVYDKEKAFNLKKLDEELRDKTKEKL